MIWTYLIILIFLSATLVQCWFWGIRFRLLANYHPSHTTTNRGATEHFPPVSVIICAHNEADNLRRYLPLFLEQDYPNFELIVVNDNSTDKTLEVLLDFQKRFPILQTLSMEGDTPPGKKAALNYGILNASFETILLSDADCQPSSTLWLKTMQGHLARHEIVLGYSPYLHQNGWLNRFIRFEAFYTTIQYLSFALAGQPYMGVGRNLGYQRSVFERVNGFSSHTHLISGDDDLLVNQTASADNTSICISPEAWVYSTPKTSWHSYYIQKRRHLSVGSHYRQKDQWALGALAFSHFSFYACGLLLLILLPSWWPILTTFYLVRMGLMLHVAAEVGKRLGVRDLIPFLPLLDFFYLAYYLAFAPSLLNGSRIQQWK